MEYLRDRTVRSHRCTQGVTHSQRSALQRDQITIEVDIPKTLPPILCHSQQIQQVIMNLVTDAQSALNEQYPGYDKSKTLAIRAMTRDENGIPWLRITVEDRVAGIPENFVIECLTRSTPASHATRAPDPDCRSATAL